MDVDTAAKLRAPFPASDVGKLPRIICPKCRDARGKACDEHAKQKCRDCGNFITPRHIHLDYVGHAELTDRLLSIDPEWNWEPLATDPNTGGPALDSYGGMWIKLTIAGVTRVGYGHPDGKTGGDAIKETIGDCLVRGTPVVTDRGTLPIEDVRIGDSVPTRLGWRPVTDHWLSASGAPVVAVLLADGRVIAGTSHHRVPTTDGSKRIGALRNGDKLFAWQGIGESPDATKSSGMAADTDGSQNILTATAGSTSWPQRHPGATYTGTCTRPPTAPSPTGGTYITPTTTPTTTTLPIWLPCPQRITLSTTGNCWKVLRGPATSAETCLSRAGVGVAGVQQRARNAADAAMASPTLLRARGRWPSHESVRSAEPTTSPVSRGPSSAVLPVVAVMDAGLAEVWNLSVGEVHEYVANGIFVYNSLRNAAMRFGVALDLWRKEPSHADDTAEGAGEAPTGNGAQKPEQSKDPARLRESIARIGKENGWTIEELADDFKQRTGGTNNIGQGTVPELQGYLRWLVQQPARQREPEAVS